MSVRRPSGGAGVERSSGPLRVAPAIAPLDVRLLGRVELTVGGREIRLGSRSAQALLAVLALKPRTRTREAVATEIWPDGDGGGTSASLRQALWVVRSAFASAGIHIDTYLEVDPEVIGLRPSARPTLDVARFEAYLREHPSRPEDAIELYRGDLVECLALECFAFERERLSDAYEDALALVAERRLLAGDAEGARDAAETLLGRDPLREEAHAALLRVHGRIGSRAQVVRQYRRLTELLDRELGVEPLPDTAAAYRAALAETVERSRRRAAGPVFSGAVAGPGSGPGAGPVIKIAAHG